MPLEPVFESLPPESAATQQSRVRKHTISTARSKFFFFLGNLSICGRGSYPKCDTRRRSPAARPLLFFDRQRQARRLSSPRRKRFLAPGSLNLKSGTGRQGGPDITHIYIYACICVCVCVCVCVYTIIRTCGYMRMYHIPDTQESYRGHIHLHAASGGAGEAVT